MKSLFAKISGIIGKDLEPGLVPERLYPKDSLPRRLHIPSFVHSETKDERSRNPSPFDTRLPLLLAQQVHGCLGDNGHGRGHWISGL